MGKRGGPGSSAAAPDNDFGRTIRAVVVRRHDFRGQSDPAKILRCSLEWRQIIAVAAVQQAPRAELCDEEDVQP
ncbi:hypothetical protein NK983_29645, partial [Salmonella enterica subsp. enterica serovar Typhimurium]|nr:hypothetical protein [Salmonella enterica subsp. enterica serovar Typhimurium]